jgi:hypothetical protein
VAVAVLWGKEEQKTGELAGLASCSQGDSHRPGDKGPVTCRAGPSSWQPLQYCFLGLGVEDVQVVHVEGYLEILAHSRSTPRIHSSYEVLALHHQVQVPL